MQVTISEKQLGAFFAVSQAEILILIGVTDIFLVL